MGDIGDREIYKLVEYTGTEESAIELINNLELQEGYYDFQLRSRCLYVHRGRVMYQPGDKYIICKCENFEAVK